jgi:hypothetical protein
MSQNEFERKTDEMYSRMTRQLLDSAWQRNNPLTTAYTGSNATMEMIDAYRDSIISGMGVSRSPSFTEVPQGVYGGNNWPAISELSNVTESAEAIRQAATAAERARIFAALEECRPTEQPYSRIQWRWEEKGRREQFDKMMKALGVTECSD